MKVMLSLALSLPSNVFTHNRGHIRLKITLINGGLLEFSEHLIMSPCLQIYDTLADAGIKCYHSDSVGRRIFLKEIISAGTN